MKASVRTTNERKFMFLEALMAGTFGLAFGVPFAFLRIAWKDGSSWNRVIVAIAGMLGAFTLYLVSLRSLRVREAAYLASKLKGSASGNLSRSDLLLDRELDCEY